MEKDVIIVEKLMLVIKKRVILNDVSVAFERGKIHGLIGRNGSGKTMLMKCICGFIHPTSGSIHVNGKEIGKDIDYPENMGIIIETPGFISRYSGRKNLKVLAELNNKIKLEDINDSMSKLGLDPELTIPVRKYSLGMRQRLGLAQAIMEDPDIMILDEPMNGLDKRGVADVRELLMNLRGQGKTIILASHSSEDIALLCDKTYEIENGALSAL
jgi:ABC-2 type transport system ATP-binding protein